MLDYIIECSFSVLVMPIKIMYGLRAVKTDTKLEFLLPEKVEDRLGKKCAVACKAEADGIIDTALLISDVVRNLANQVET